MTPRLALKVYKEILSLPAGSTVLLRAPERGEPGMFERVLSRLCLEAKVNVVLVRPDRKEGRSANFNRDYQMVNSADYVEVFFSTERTMVGGTAHLVEAAMNRQKPVYAWQVEQDGQISRIGEIEATDLAGDLTFGFGQG